MTWLLKIVEGPQTGAEVALPTGTRVRVGSTDDCDVIVSDASVSAFVLDVSERDVTLVTASGETRVLKPFVIETRGTTAFAVGPSEGAWQPLERPAPEPVAEPEPAPASPASEEPPADASSREKTGRRGCGCAAACLLVLLLLALVILSWLFWPRIRDRHPDLARTVESSVVTMRGWFSAGGTKKAVVAPVPGPTLAEIARQYGLELLEKDGHPLLKGNVRRRTERQAIRALALNEDVRTAFDLTDDESLKASADELLFVVTEGALKAVAASNRVVAVTGYAPSSAELERAVRALNVDVPGIERLDTAAVQVGGTPPPALARTKFAAPALKAAAQSAATAPRRDYPIAGIVMKPYPIVVMRNGLRLAEGAQVGSATIERIEADRLVLRDGKSTFEWRP